MNEAVYTGVTILAGIVLLLLAAAGALSALGLLPNIWSREESRGGSSSAGSTSASSNYSLVPLVLIVIFFGGMILIYFWPR